MVRSISSNKHGVEFHFYTAYTAWRLPQIEEGHVHWLVLMLVLV